MELGILPLSDPHTDPATGTRIRLLRLALPPGIRDRPAARRAETAHQESLRHVRQHLRTPARPGPDAPLGRRRGREAGPPPHP